MAYNKQTVQGWPWRRAVGLGLAPALTPLSSASVMFTSKFWNVQREVIVEGFPKSLIATDRPL